MPKVIIFDVDGTLAETEEIHRLAFNETFAHFKLDWQWSQENYRELLRVTGGKERIRKFLNDIAIDPVDFPDARIDALHAFKTERYVALMKTGQFDLRPGIRELIELARSMNHRLAIATTTSRANVDCLLEGAFGRAGLAMFDTMVCGDEVPKKKPAPDVYLRVMEQLQVAPADCIAVEDSRNGMLAAHAAGIRVAITPAFYTSDDDFSGSDWIIDDNESLLDLLVT